jgi:hypothetical protein
MSGHPELGGLMFKWAQHGRDEGKLTDDLHQLVIDWQDLFRPVSRSAKGRLVLLQF